MCLYTVQSQVLQISYVFVSCALAGMVSCPAKRPRGRGSPQVRQSITTMQRPYEHPSSSPFRCGRGCRPLLLLHPALLLHAPLLLRPYLLLLPPSVPPLLLPVRPSAGMTVNTAVVYISSVSDYLSELVSIVGAEHR